MSTKETLIQKALAEIKEYSEGDFKRAVQGKIRSIAEKQSSIKTLQGEIATLQKEIREMELVPIEDSVLG